MKKVFIMVLCLVLSMVTLAGCGGANSVFKNTKDLLEEKIAENSNYVLYYEVASDDSYIKIDTNPTNAEDYYDPDALELIKTVNESTGFSDALYEKMVTTTANDGKQSDENDDFEVSWSYHPDNGLEILYEKK